MTIDDINTWSESLVGQTLAKRYRLDGLIGVGAMGTVFRARHLGLNRDVALKLLNAQLSANPEMQARFSREAAAASKLDHPNCVRVTDYGITDDGHQFLVMELLQGVELADLIDQPLPVDRALSIMDQLLAGLEHAHAHGLVHRDVKPENLFLTRGADGRELAKLLDFGIVKIDDHDGQPLTRFGMVFGTPLYMSPEQAAGKPTDARTDLYSAGLILYSMLSGQPPFQADDPVVLVRMQMKASPEPLPSTVPAVLRGLIDRLLAKEPDERPATATEVRQEVRKIRDQLREPAPAKPEASKPEASVARPPSRWREQRTRVAIAGGTVAVAIAIASAVAMSDGDEPGETSGARAVDNDEVSAEKAANAEMNADSPAADATDGEEAGGRNDGSRALDANLAAIDALMAAKKHDAAEIALTPLLTTYPEEPQLHWRMARVLVQLRGNERRSQALERYRQTLTLAPELLENEVLAEELGALLDDPKLRAPAIDFTIDLLGVEGHDRLLGWLNTQAGPLPYPTRHRIIEHLEAGGRSDDINRPLQRALDLWQASTVDQPCKAFERALEAATEQPDSYLLGTLNAVSVPSSPATEGAPAQTCPELEAQLESARLRYRQRFAGIEGVVPKAYRRRTPSSASRRRRR